MTRLAALLVLAATVRAPVWLMELFEIKEMLPPLAFWVIAPEEVIAVLLPPAVSFAVIVIAPDALVRVAEPSVRIVAAVVPVAVMDIPLPALILPVCETIKPELAPVVPTPTIVTAPPAVIDPVLEIARYVDEAVP